jgi:hypothetical protein
MKIGNLLMQVAARKKESQRKEKERGDASKFPRVHTHKETAGAGSRFSWVACCAGKDVQLLKFVA